MLVSASYSETKSQSQSQSQTLLTTNERRPPRAAVELVIAAVTGSAPGCLLNLVQAIDSGDRDGAARLLDGDPNLATARAEIGATRRTASEFWLGGISHYLYAGDTALHVAAAAYWPDLVRQLCRAGAAVGAPNRRRATPLHYAVDGNPQSPRWSPDAQRETVRFLVELGADPNAADSGGVTPLHRAVRNRCADAVHALLQCGADPQLTNKSGSTPLLLARLATGRGGSGSPEAKEQQALILRLLEG